MRTVFVAALDRHVSALGFGCASLGSRISEAQGLRALNYALDRGVTWCDVAPSYGGGEAEAIVGKFLSGRRDKITVCTKIGVPRPAISPFMRLIRPAARAIANALPKRGRQKAGKKHSGHRLDAEEFEDFVNDSLRRLRTEYIDVLALEEPQLQDCTDGAVIEALRRLIDKGRIRAVSIAGTADAVIAGARISEIYKIAQLGDNPFTQSLARVKGALGDPRMFFVTHGVFGMGGYERLSHLLVSDGGRLGALASQLAYGPPFMASEMLLDYAFATNPDGVVLASMFSQSHIAMNCTRASRAPRKDIGPFMQKFVVAAAK